MANNRSYTIKCRSRHGLHTLLLLFIIHSTPLSAQMEVEQDEASSDTTAIIMQDENSAGATVEQLHRHLIEIMQQSEELGYKGRYNKIAPYISANFDTPLIAKVILSRYWTELSTQQQQSFIELFNRLSIATYASRFNKFSGQEFQETGREELKKGRLIIKTELHRPDDKPVKMDYLMHQQDGKWLIISVIANGVNDLSLKRAEYASVIKDRGFDGLVEDLKGKIREMESDKTP